MRSAGTRSSGFWSGAGADAAPDPNLRRICRTQNYPDAAQQSKAFAFDSGPPIVWDKPAATYERTADEHGRLALSAATNRLGADEVIE